MKKFFWILVIGFWLLVTAVYAQEEVLEFNLDVKSKTTSLPEIFSPGVDLSGRGYHRRMDWPYHLAAKEVLERWEKEISFKGLYRMYWNIWEIEQVKLDKPLKKMLLDNYESIIKSISEAGGRVILTLYGSPPGMGRALDKRSPPSNLKQWKVLIKDTIRYLSCEKKYNIWYEVWSAPDTEDFFLGVKKDYLNIYRMVAEAVRELEKEKKMEIFVGGPAVTWWFQNFNGNTILTPEQSLIYELIKFCSRRKLPLDFISWHAYSTDPKVEKEITSYNKSISRLIRDWLLYFKFDENTPLIVDEWNFDTGSNLIEERGKKSYIAASFIPPRLKSMHEAGIDYQIFFSLEDFQNNKEGIKTNRGIFYYDPEYSTYRGKAKAMYNVFLMLNSLGNQIFNLRLTDEFVGTLATKKSEDLIILIWNYIDPFLARNHISRNIALLSDKEQGTILGMINSGKFDKLLEGGLSLKDLNLGDKLKTLLKEAIELHNQAENYKDKARHIRINLSNIEGDYLYQRYSMNSSCTMDCSSLPVEEEELNINEVYQKMLELEPYSAHLIILKKMELEDKDKQP